MFNDDPPITLIYHQIKKNGRTVAWTTTVNGKLLKAKSMRHLRMMAYRELCATGPYVIVDHTY
jgi:hypothetical protein